MNGGRHRGPIDIEGCLSGVGYMFLIGLGCFAIGAFIVWIFSPPEMVCKQFKEIEVIEEIKNGTRMSEVLVKKKVCVEWSNP